MDGSSSERADRAHQRDQALGAGERRQSHQRRDGSAQAALAQGAHVRAMLCARRLLLLAARLPSAQVHRWQWCALVVLCHMQVVVQHVREQARVGQVVLERDRPRRAHRERVRQGKI